jgi:hypothetical protein
MDQDEDVGYFSKDIITGHTLFLDITLKEWEADEGWGEPSLYI